MEELEGINYDNLKEKMEEIFQKMYEDDIPRPRTFKLGGIRCIMFKDTTARWNE